MTAGAVKTDAERRNESAVIVEIRIMKMVGERKIVSCLRTGGFT